MTHSSWFDLVFNCNMFRIRGYTVFGPILPILVVILLVRWVGVLSHQKWNTTQSQSGWDNLVQANTDWLFWYGSKCNCHV